MDKVFLFCGGFPVVMILSIRVFLRMFDWDKCKEDNFGQTIATIWVVSTAMLWFYLVKKLG